MRIFDKTRLWLRSLFRRSQVEDELTGEFAFHFEQQVEENIARGMSDTEARAAALLAMGSIASLQDECRDLRRQNYLDDLRADLRYAIRALRRNRTFAAIAMLTLGLGIGACTALLNAVTV